MLCLLAIMAVLAVRSLTLEGGAEGLKFYLQPNFKNLMYDANGKWRLGESIFAAMGQAFFTLSLGIGAIAVFGSYIDRQYALEGEALRIGILDTFVAFVAGLIIFPACSAFGVSPDQGASLIFITLPNIFNEMPLGQLWGALFFVFLSFAGPVHRHRRVREYHFLRHGYVGLEPEEGRAGQPDRHLPAVYALCAGL